MPFLPGSFIPGSYDTQRPPAPKWNQERVNYNSPEQQLARGWEPWSPPPSEGD